MFIRAFFVQIVRGFWPVCAILLYCLAESIRAVEEFNFDWNKGTLFFATQVLVANLSRMLMQQLVVGHKSRLRCVLAISGR